jgi:hypothetical protein
MRTRAQFAGLVALMLVGCAACKAVELDLAIPDGAAGDPAAPISCAADAVACNGTATPVCNEEAGVCVQCLSASDCPERSNIPHCVNNVCIACTGDPDCNDGGSTGSRVCNKAIPRCATRCDQDSAACDGLGPLPYACLAPEYQWCAECTDQDSQCVGRPGGTHCYGLPSGACGCLDDGDCPDAGRCQPPSGLSHLRFCEPPALLE